MDGFSLGADPQVQASPKYLLVYGSGSYTFYDRKTRKPLVATGCVPISGSFLDLFAPLMLERDASGARNDNDINRVVPQSPIRCDPSDIEACPGSCIEEIYDARAFFERDDGSGRWWIAVAARNQMYQGDPFSGCPENGVQPKQAQRYVFVAVSRSEDPNDGFYAYALARDYADWPLFAVNNGRLLIAHKKDSKKVFVFDADKLAGGTGQDPFLGQYDDDAFPEVDRITPVTQYSSSELRARLRGRLRGRW
jgi:hypothetical protein